MAKYGGEEREIADRERSGERIFCLSPLGSHALPHTHTHSHPFNGPFSGTTWAGRYQKDEINLDFTEARDSEWQWHQLGCMQVCTSLQTDNHASAQPFSFLQAGCPSCRRTNSVKAVATNLLQLALRST